MSETKTLSKPKAIGHLVAYFALFLVGELLSSFAFDLLFSVVHLSVYGMVALQQLGGLALTLVLFWLYTTKVLKRTMKSFRITLSLKRWAVVCAVCLPVTVAAAYWIIGDGTVHSFGAGETVAILLVSLLFALKSGLLEEMLFRGYIMRLLEESWGRCLAVLAPSVLFALVHVPQLSEFTPLGVGLLVVAGTLVGVMFSLLAMQSGSVSNSALAHILWNFVIVSDVLHIATAANQYGSPLMSAVIPGNNPLLTGGEFGMESSLIAIGGYLLVCLACLRKKPQ